MAAKGDDVLVERARRLLERSAAANLGEGLGTLAVKLLARLERDPAAHSLVLGPETPRGGATFESLLRDRRSKVAAVPPERIPEERDLWAEGPGEGSGVRSVRWYGPEDAPEGVPRGTVVEIHQGPEGGRCAPREEFVHLDEHPIRFEHLNPVQSLLLPWVTLDVNVVLAATTSAGKTLSAELLMSDALHRGGSALFLSPLRAVTQEKHQDWTEEGHAWASRGVEIVTGDYRLTEARKAALAVADVVALTTEMLDARTRRIEHEGNRFLLDCAVLVSDESHMLTMEGRGDALEAGLMRFSKLNPRCRLVLLSATMPNVAELAAWLSKLNGKPTVVIKSDWRPTKLTIAFPTYRAQASSYQYNEESKRRAARDLIQAHPNDSWLAFVHGKDAGRKLLDLLAKSGIQAEFHSADLDLKGRLRVEAAFRERRLRVVVATSTLAYGVNLPARRVVVVGVHRGIDEVDPIDVRQECGRAGRVGLDPEGHAYVLLPELNGRYPEALREKFCQIRPITSTLADLNVLAFHLVAEIAESRVETIADAVAWHARSLAALQGRGVQVRDERTNGALAFGTGAPSAEDVVERLEKVGCLKAEAAGRYVATSLGRVASWLYFSPFDVAYWAMGFSRMVRTEVLRDDDLIAWALGNTPSAREDGYVPRELQESAEEVRFALAGRGLPGERISMRCLAVRAMLKGQKHPRLQGEIRAVERDLDRVMTGLNLIQRHVVRDLKPSYLRLLQARVRYGVPWGAAPLCELPGVGGVRAVRLYRAGYKNPTEILASPAAVREILGSKVGQKVIEAARALQGGGSAPGGLE